MKRNNKTMAREANTKQITLPLVEGQTEAEVVTARLININKKLQTPTGKEVVRKALIQVRQFDDFEDMNSVYMADEIAKFAQIGMLYRARVIGNNQLVSGSMSDETKALMKTFRQSMDTLVNIMDIPKEDALKTLLSKPTFAKLEDTIKALESAGDLAIDYVSAPVPLPSEGEDDDEAAEGEAAPAESEAASA